MLGNGLCFRNGSVSRGLYLRSYQLGSDRGERIRICIDCKSEENADRRDLELYSRSSRTFGLSH